MLSVLFHSVELSKFRIVWSEFAFQPINLTIYLLLMANLPLENYLLKKMYSCLIYPLL